MLAVPNSRIPGGRGGYCRIVPIAPRKRTRWPDGTRDTAFGVKASAQQCHRLAIRAWGGEHAQRGPPPSPKSKQQPPNEPPTSPPPTSRYLKSRGDNSRRFRGCRGQIRPMIPLIRAVSMLACQLNSTHRHPFEEVSLAPAFQSKVILHVMLWEVSLHPHDRVVSIMSQPRTLQL